MKRKILLLVAVAALMSFPAFSANNDAHDVTINVPLTVDLNLTVGGGGITLNAGNTYSDNTTRYTLQHNAGANYNITAQVTGGAGDPTGIDFDTTVAQPGVGASAGTVALIAAGVINVAAQNVVTGVPKGSYLAGYMITYDAAFDMTATIGNQVFTVTYTAVP